ERQTKYLSVRPSFAGRVWDSLRNSLARPSLASGRADFLFAAHPRRRRTADGRWSEPYVDPLLPHLGATAAVVEPPFLGRHYAPTLIPGVRYLDDVELLGAVRKFVARPRLGAEQERLAEAVARELWARFPTDPDVVGELRRAHELRVSRLPLYRALLARVRPKVVVVLVSYGNEALVEAARERGIPTVELQHGTIHPYHLGYTYPA